MTERQIKSILSYRTQEVLTIEAEESFDLIEFQQKARETCCPKKLFAMWEDVCKRYERHEIGSYELEEMKEVIWPSLEALASLRKSVNDTGEVVAKKSRRKARVEGA